MKTVLIKNGMLVSPDDGYHQKIGDILIKDGVIAQIGQINEVADEIIDASGCLVTPGFIDAHAHCYAEKTSLGVMPDTVGIDKGVTTLIDAGSSGPDNFEDFLKTCILPSKTKVYALLNISKRGLEERHELDDMAKVDVEKVKAMIRKYPQYIVGIKARASASVVKEQGIKPIKLAIETAHQLQLPIMIHTGNYPPKLTDVLNLMDHGDVLTHAFHGKKGGIIAEDGSIITEAIQARQRGVIFDIGHGSASFSYKVLQQAQQQFAIDLVSTDIHSENYNGPVYSQHAVINKLINLGEDLETTIAKATTHVAKVFNLKNLGHLKVGYIGDIGIHRLEVVEPPETVVDSEKEPISIRKKLVPVTVVYSQGKESNVKVYE